MVTQVKKTKQNGKQTGSQQKESINVFNVQKITQINQTSNLERRSSESSRKQV